jgi:hypothetical protein
MNMMMMVAYFVWKMLSRWLAAALHFVRVKLLRS